MSEFLPSLFLNDRDWGLCCYSSSLFAAVTAEVLFFLCLSFFDHAEAGAHFIFRDSPAVRCLENRACIFSSTPQAGCAQRKCSQVYVLLRLYLYFYLFTPFSPSAFHACRPQSCRWMILARPRTVPGSSICVCDVWCVCACIYLSIYLSIYICIRTYVYINI